MSLGAKVSEPPGSNGPGTTSFQISLRSPLGMTSQSSPSGATDEMTDAPAGITSVKVSSYVAQRTIHGSPGWLVLPTTRPLR